MLSALVRSTAPKALQVSQRVGQQVVRQQPFHTTPQPIRIGRFDEFGGGQEVEANEVEANRETCKQATQRINRDLTAAFVIGAGMYGLLCIGEASPDNKPEKAEDKPIGEYTAQRLQQEQQESAGKHRK